MSLPLNLEDSVISQENPLTPQVTTLPFSLDLKMLTAKELRNGMTIK
jgi:hypothetical protein